MDAVVLERMVTVDQMMSETGDTQWMVGLELQTERPLKQLFQSCQPASCRLVDEGIRVRFSVTY